MSLPATGEPGPVVVLGDVMTDVVARVDDPLALGSDTSAHVSTHQGGAGANVAAWLARLGVPTTFVGRVGDDPFGREAVHVLASGGVRVLIGTDAALPTGTVVVLVGADGERTMLPDAGANSALLPEHLPFDQLAEAGHLHVSGYTLLNPGSRAAGRAALAGAASSGVVTSVDAASAAPLEVLGGKEFLALTAGVDLLLCTLDEAEVLAGTRDPDVALARLTGGYAEVVLKLGGDGARWAADGAPAGASVPAGAPSGPVLDTTGAGDAFAAGYLAARRRGTTPVQAMAEGTTLAARVVVRSGTRPDPPD
jgi:ribokinase